MEMKQKRLDRFTALKALCCLSVISLHCYILFIAAYVGVTVFFLMSGFLQTYNTYEKNTLDDVNFTLCARFSWNKIKKLYPLHFLTLLFFLAEQFYGLFTGLAKPGWEFFSPILANILLIQSWFPTERFYYSLNVPSWYLSVSVFLYLMFPLILKAVKRLKSVSQAVWLSAAIYAVQIFFTKIGYDLWPDKEVRQWVRYVFPPLRLGTFAIGCNLGYIYLKMRDRRFGPVKATAFEVLTILITVLTIYDRNLPDWFPKYGSMFSYSLKFILPAVMIVIAFAFGEGLIVKLLTNKPLLYLGRLSSNMYLIHYPLVAIAALFVTRMNCSPQAQRAIYLVFIAVFTVGLSEVYSRVQKRKETKKRGS